MRVYELAYMNNNVRLISQWQDGFSEFLNQLEEYF